MLFINEYWFNRRSILIGCKSKWHIDCAIASSKRGLNQGSTNRLVRGSTGPNRSEIFKIFLVLVRSEILKFSWSWSGQVPRSKIFSVPGPSWSGISQIFSVLVRFGPGFLKIFRSGLFVQLNILYEQNQMNDS